LLPDQALQRHDLETVAGHECVVAAGAGEQILERLAALQKSRRPALCTGKCASPAQALSSRTARAMSPQQW
jgi:hypothetical protein